MIIAATGHRPNKLGGYDDGTLSRLYLGAHQYLEQQKPAKVISGMAQGWDTAWALAAMDLKIPFIAALPCKGQASVWPQLAQDRWAALLCEAAEVVMVSTGEYAVWKMQARNKWMVDHADRVCALWDGSDGGTSNCVKYAQKVKKPIDNLWDEYAAVRKN